MVIMFLLTIMLMMMTDEGTVGDDDDEQVRKSLVAEKAYNKALFNQTQLNYSSEATCTS